MPFNWITLAMVAIVVFSGLFGIFRGFRREAFIVMRQFVSIITGLVAIFIAWTASHYVASFVLHAKISKNANWLTHLFIAWQKSPRIATWIVFLICYLILSSILAHIVSLLFASARRSRPSSIGKSRFLGGSLGLLVGVIRAAVVGAIIFVVIQFSSISTVTKAATASGPYQLLSARIYRPLLKPLVSKTLPVLAQTALQPIAQNIAIFAVPSGPNGAETGALAIPSQISDLSHRLTKGITNPTDRARVLYQWERTHITYDWAKYNDYVYHHKWDAQTPLQTLQSGKGVCADYALLYADLAHAAHLSVRIDEGLGGTTSNFGSHAWNAVYIPQSKHWILVDTTWGAEQNDWFDVPPTKFNQTHVKETTITIPANAPNV